MNCYMLPEIGDTFVVNKGLPETLIKIEFPYAVFKSEKYTVVRRLTMLLPLKLKKKQDFTFAVTFSKSGCIFEKETNQKLIQHNSNDYKTKRHTK